MDRPSANKNTSNEEARKHAVYRRIVLALQKQLNTKEDLDGNLNLKRKSDSASITRLGRGIRRLVHLYSAIPDLIFQADLHKLQLSEEHDSDPVEFIGMDEDTVADIKRERERSYFAINELVKLIPNFYKRVDKGDPEELELFYRQLQKGANDARSDDVKKLKEAVANWLNSWSPPPRPLIAVDCRLERGIQHDTTGYLLCPVDYDWNDETVRAKLRAAEEGFDFTSSFFCRFLYRGYNADLNDLEEGFLKSNLLLKTFKFIFTSPHSCKEVSAQGQEDSDIGDQGPSNKFQKTSQGKATTRNSVASTLRMDNKVTPRSIAYVAAQLHFALSSAPHWTDIHEGFNYQDFYHFVVDFFEVTEGPISQQRVQKLLQWWTMQIFPNSAPRTTSSTSASKEAFRAQRKAREPGAA